MKLAWLVGAGMLVVTALVAAQVHSQPQTQTQRHTGSAQVPLPRQEDTESSRNSGSSEVDAIGNPNVSCNFGAYNSFSLERQVSIGRSAAQQVESHVKFVNDPVITEYVNRIGQNLARNSNAQLSLTVKVIDSDVVNALSLPGGFLYVNSGLILAADDEAELAGIMAHEIAHIVACHAGRQWSSAEKVSEVPSAPITLAASGDCAAGMFGIARFSRGFEAEADYLGIVYLYRAGYDPFALVSYFEKINAIKKRTPGAVARAFETHPQSPDRIERSEREIRSILPSKPEYLVSNSDFDQVKARLAANRPALKVREDSNYVP